MDLKQESEGTQIQQQRQEQQHFHVLAVDDSLIDRKLLERLLTFSSYQVTCVDSGDKALEYLGLLESTENNSTICSSCSSCASCPTQPPPQEEQSLKVNLIMTDYSMPGMNGYDLLKRVKGSYWKDVPVVVMSSENVPSRINMCLEGGAEEFLLKPVKLSDLRKIQSHLLNSLSLTCKNNDSNYNSNNDDGNGNSNNNNNDKNSNITANKRKAICPEQSERRPKLKEVAVL